MPTKRLPMRQLREILRLHLHSQLGVRQIHRTLSISVGSVSKIVKQAHEQQLDWRAICQLDDVKLAQRFYPKANNQLSDNLGGVNNYKSQMIELTKYNMD